MATANGTIGGGWHSATLTYIDGEWVEGNPGIMGPRTHAAWLGSSVFDGARAFEGRLPDLDRHCARVNRSALALGLEPTMEPEAIAALAREGARRFGPEPQLYVKPMYWAEADGLATIAGDPASTRFCLCLFEAPMPPAGTGLALTVSPYRRPTIETMPTDAKAGCLYPNNARALRDARARGFDNAIVLDMLGNVAELATANLFLVRDGVVFTPAPNGTFLAGITRSRVADLLRGEGVEVVEAALTVKDFLEADEAFTSGNYAKTVPVVRIEDRAMQPGPVGRRARDLYWAFAHDG